MSDIKPKFEPGDIVLLDVTKDDFIKYGADQLLSSIHRIESVCEGCDNPYELDYGVWVKEWRLLKIQITLAEPNP